MMALKTSKIKLWQWLLIATPALLGIYFVVKKSKKKNLQTNPKRQDKTEQLTVAVKQVSSNCQYPLQKGSKNDCVKILQTAMVDVFEDPLPKYGIDGDFGNETEYALEYATGKKTITDAQELVTVISQLYAGQMQANKLAPLPTDNGLTNPATFNPLSFLNS